MKTAAHELSCLPVASGGDTSARRLAALEEAQAELRGKKRPDYTVLRRLARELTATGNERDAEALSALERGLWSPGSYITALQQARIQIAATLTLVRLLHQAREEWHG